MPNPPLFLSVHKPEHGRHGKRLDAQTLDGVNSQLDPREAALLSELDAMGLSRVMLQIAQAIGFDNFMAMWQILDGSHEAIAENDSGIYIRLQRLSSYKRFQRNRFIESMASMGMPQHEISRSVTRDLGEKVSDRHIFRLMAGRKIKP